MASQHPLTKPTLAQRALEHWPLPSSIPGTPGADVLLSRQIPDMSRQATSYLCRLSMDVVVHLLCPMVAVLNSDKPRMEIKKIESRARDARWVCLHESATRLCDSTSFCVLPGGSIWLVQGRYCQNVGHETWLSLARGKPPYFVAISSFIAHDFHCRHPRFSYCRATQSAALEITGCWRLIPKFRPESNPQRPNRHADVLPSPCIEQQIILKHVPETEDGAMPDGNALFDVVNGDTSLRIPTRAKPPFKLVAHMNEILRRQRLAPCEHHPRKRRPVSFGSPTKYINPHPEPKRIRLPLPSDLLLHYCLTWTTDELGRFHILAVCCQERSQLLNVILVYAPNGAPLACVQFPYDDILNGSDLGIRVDAAGNYLVLARSGHSLWVVDSSRGNFHRIKKPPGWRINVIEIIHDGSIAVLLYDGTIWRLDVDEEHQQ